MRRPGSRLRSRFLASRTTALAVMAVSTTSCFNFNFDGVDVSIPPCAGGMPKSAFAQPEFDKATAPEAVAGGTWRPWTHGSALAVRGDRAYALDADNGTLVILDTKSMQVLETRKLGQRPEQVVVGPDGAIYVSLRHGSAVVRYAPEAKTAEMWPVGVEPVGLALSADAKTLLVVVAGENRLRALDAVTGAEVGFGETDARPIAVAVNGAGTVVVTHQHGDARVYSLKLMLAATDKGSAAGAQRQLDRFALGAGCADEQPESIKPTRAVAVAVDPRSDEFRIAHVVASPGIGQDSVNAALSTLPSAKDDCAPDGLGAKGGGASSGGGGYGATVPGCSNPRRPVDVAVTRLAADGSSKPSSQMIAVGDPKQARPLAARFDQPSDVRHHPTHALAFMTAFGTDNVLVLNENKAGSRPVAVLEMNKIFGQAPKAIAFAEDGLHAFVLAAHSFQVNRIPLHSLLNKAGDPNYVAQVVDQTIEQADRVQIGEYPLPEAARLGRRTFHYARNERISKDNQFACATCHLDGGEDKLTWFITNGARQTPVLSGRLVGTGPFNWKGTEDELSTNMKDTVHRMGGLGLVANELTVLEQYLLVGLPPAPPNPNTVAPALSEAQVRGKKLFNDPKVGCASCHVAGTGSDGALHDVGTANETDRTVAQILHPQDWQGRLNYNTPSLRGLHASAPYLHDGSAATLKQALLQTKGKMGQVGHLDASQLADLEAYLLTL